VHLNHMALILGSSGIIPGSSLIVRFLETEGDNTRVTAIDANRSEADMLLRGALRGISAEA